MKTITTNHELELLLGSIRNSCGNSRFETQDEIDAYFKTAILIFNNIKEPYWKGCKKGEVKYDDYLQEKMDIIYTDDSSKTINQLYELWLSKTTTTIEFNLRGLEFIAREHAVEFDKNVLEMIASSLEPLERKGNSLFARSRLK